jgi:hypothetical protein
MPAASWGNPEVLHRLLPLVLLLDTDMRCEANDTQRSDRSSVGVRVVISMVRDPGMRRSRSIEHCREDEHLLEIG